MSGLQNLGLIAAGGVLAWLLPLLARRLGFTSFPGRDRRLRITGLGYSLHAGTMVLSLQNVSDQDVRLTAIRVRSLDRQGGRIPSALPVSWHTVDLDEGRFSKPVDVILAGEFMLLLLHHQHLRAWMQPGAKLRAAVATGEEATLGATIKIRKHEPDMPWSETLSPDKSSKVMGAPVPLYPPAVGEDQSP